MGNEQIKLKTYRDNWAIILTRKIGYPKINLE